MFCYINPSLSNAQCHVISKKIKRRDPFVFVFLNILWGKGFFPAVPSVSLQFSLQVTYLRRITIVAVIEKDIVLSEMLSLRNY